MVKEVDFIYVDLFSAISMKKYNKIGVSVF